MPRKDNQKESAAAEDLDGNVDQIRQILFGGQMRDYEKRFVELEKRLSKSIEQLANTMEKRIDRLDAQAKREFDKITDKLRAEQKARLEDGKESAKELTDLGHQVEAWFAEVEEQMETDSKEVSTALKSQGEEILAVVQETSDQLNSSMRDEARELADGKLSREDLAELLSEVALRLKKDFKLPKR